MPLQSAGILLYRHRGGSLEVLLVHPGGPYNARKDLGAWSIPKGLLEAGEEGLAAAKREFEEELGMPLLSSHFIPLSPVKQKGGKMVHAWAAEGDVDAMNIHSNIIRVEYPYKSGRWIAIPEVDKAGWFSLEAAALRIIPAQQSFLDELAVIAAAGQQ